jgi:alcohol dehydrogenase
MEAAVFDAYGGPVTLRTVATPIPPTDGVVVRVLACGVCRSDWLAWKGADPVSALPHVPGHELAGIVEEVGPHCIRWRPGDRVTAPFVAACGTCGTCRAGHATACLDQYVIGFSGWGAFAEFVAIPHADFNLVAVPDGIEPTVAAALGCRVTTAFGGIVDRARLGPGEWLAVHACGGIGLSAVMLGAAVGASVIAIDINPEKLALAERLGATESIDARAVDDIPAAIKGLTGGGADVSVDALGSAATCRNSILCLRTLGRHVQIGQPTLDDDPPTIPVGAVYAGQLTVLGTRGLAPHRFSALFKMIAAGRIDPGLLITRRLGLDEAGDALAAMDSYEELGVAVIDRF